MTEVLNRNILVTTTSYPKSKLDNSGIFVEELSKRLSVHHNLFVLTPFAQGTQQNEAQKGVRISRFKYWPSDNLFTDGESMSILRMKPLLILQVIPFFILQLVEIHRLVKEHSISVIMAHWLVPQGLIAVIYKSLFSFHA